jgi:hypothetical protein
MFYNIKTLIFAPDFSSGQKIDAVRHEVIVRRLRFSFKVYVNGIRG